MPTGGEGMVAFPLISFCISALFTALLFRRYLQKHRLHELVWMISFSCFAVASACEVFGDLWGWNEWIARLYYLTGAMLVVGFLGLGNLVLIGSRKTIVISSCVMAIFSLGSLFAVITARIDPNKLQAVGWQALEKGPFLLALTILLNSIGTLVVIASALYSAWQIRRIPDSKQRMQGLIWIAVGTLVVASGGTLTRFGHHEYLYLAMAPGVALIFYGYLLTIRLIQPEKHALVA
jgi:hypothetical protein